MLQEIITEFSQQINELKSICDKLNEANSKLQAGIQKFADKTWNIAPYAFFSDAHGFATVKKVRIEINFITYNIFVDYSYIEKENPLKVRHFSCELHHFIKGYKFIR